MWNLGEAEITLQDLYYQIKHYHNNKEHFELNMPGNGICDICKEYFRTLKLLEYHSETKHQDPYAKTPNTPDTTMKLKTSPFNTCLTKILSWGEDSW